MTTPFSAALRTQYFTQTEKNIERKNRKKKEREKRLFERFSLVPGRRKAASGDIQARPRRIQVGALFDILWQQGPMGGLGYHLPGDRINVSSLLRAQPRTGSPALMCMKYVNRGPLKNDVSLYANAGCSWEERHLSEKQDGPIAQGSRPRGSGCSLPGESRSSGGCCDEWDEIAQHAHPSVQGLPADFSQADQQLLKRGAGSCLSPKECHCQAS